MGLLDQWNKNKFSIYKSEEKTVLKLIEEIGKWIETLIKGLDGKTDLYGDHKGSWQGLKRPTLSEEGLRATVENIIDVELPNIKNSISDLKGYNVKLITEYGAKGDGKTDNTQAFINAFNSISNNTILVIPNGEYIVYKDFDGVQIGNALLLNECIKLKNKENIIIMGIGEVLIRPNNQGTSSVKKRYPCTLSIDQCSNITINNVTIESKGENYGDADAGFSQSKGDGRTNFTIQNGGSALFIARSKQVNLENVKGRFCGSCATIYFSNVSDCMVVDCFSNPASLGYASYCVDTWCDTSSSYNNTVDFINCKSWAEKIIRENRVVGSTIYSSKCGILLEGDDVLVNSRIESCLIKDAYSNSVDRYLGVGIITYNAICEVNNTTVENCNKFAYKRDTLTNGGQLIVTNSKGIKLRTHGIVIKDLYSITNTKQNFIKGNYLHILGTETFTDSEEYLKEMGGIVFAEYSPGGKTNIINNIIYCNSNPIYQLYRAEIRTQGNEFISTGYNCYFMGGGNIEMLNDKLIRHSYADTTKCLLYFNTTAKDGAKAILNIRCNNVEFNANNKTHNAISIISDNPSSLVQVDSMKNLLFNNCCSNVDATNVKIENDNPCVSLINNTQLAGSYTVLEFDLSNNIGLTKDYFVIDDNGVIRKLIKQGRKTENGRYLETFYVSTDVRGSFTANKKYNLF